MPEVSKLLGFGVFWRPLTEAGVLINGGAITASVAAGTVGANELEFESEAPFASLKKQAETLF